MKIIKLQYQSETFMIYPHDHGEGVAMQNIEDCIVVTKDQMQSPSSGWKSPERWQMIIESMQVAAKLQQILAAEQPVIMANGQLVKLPTADQQYLLGWIAALNIRSDEEYEGTTSTTLCFDIQEFNGDEYAPSLSFVIGDCGELVNGGFLTRDEYRQLWITDLGWDVLRGSQVVTK